MKNRIGQTGVRVAYAEMAKHKYIYTTITDGSNVILFGGQLIIVDHFMEDAYAPEQWCEIDDSIAIGVHRRSRLGKIFTLRNNAPRAY